MANPHEYYGIDLLVTWNKFSLTCIGMLVFFLNIRMLRLFRFSKRLSLFVDVLQGVSRDALNFGFFFTIVLLSFAQAFYLILSSRVMSYNSVYRAVETLITLLLGPFFPFADSSIFQI